jgi:peptidase A4-like protein
MRKTIVFCTSVFAAVAASALIPASGPAAADAGEIRLIPLPESAVRHDPNIRETGMREGTSTNWGGYAALTSLTSPQSGAVTDVKGTWIVPAVVASTSSKTYCANWVGIDGYSSKTVEQLGTESDVSNGSASYYAWFEMYPKRAYLISGFTVHPSDSITAEVKYIGNNKFVLSMTNNTTNQTFSTTQKGGGTSRSSAEWIVEPPYSGGVLPLADFGTTYFSGCTATINGHTGPIDDAAWANDPITMQYADGTVKATPSSLTDSAGASSFDAVWSHE